MDDKTMVATIAQRIMGWIVFVDELGRTVAEISDNRSLVLWGSQGFDYAIGWNPLGSISDAFQVVEKMREKGWQFEICTTLRTDGTRPYEVVFWMPPNPEDGIPKLDENAARAISLACLAAIESEAA